jgi:hypothetical protein
LPFTFTVTLTFCPGFKPEIVAVVEFLEGGADGFAVGVAVGFGVGVAFAGTFAAAATAAAAILEAIPASAAA